MHIHTSASILMSSLRPQFSGAVPLTSLARFVLQPWSNQWRHHQRSLFRICLLKKWMTTTRWQNSQPSTWKLKRSKWWKTFPSRLTFCAVNIYYFCDKVSPLSHYFLTLAHSFLRMPGICVTSHKSTLSRRCCAAERTIENNFLTWSRTGTKFITSSWRRPLNFFAMLQMEFCHWYLRFVNFLHKLQGLF